MDDKLSTDISHLLLSGNTVPKKCEPDEKGWVPHGQCVAYRADDGSKLMEIQYMNGIAHGEFNEFARDGKIITAGGYEHGLLDGEFKIFDSESGELIKSIMYRHGKEYIDWDHFFSEEEFLKSYQQDMQRLRVKFEADFGDQQIFTNTGYGSNDYPYKYLLMAEEDLIPYLMSDLLSDDLDNIGLVIRLKLLSDIIPEMMVLNITPSADKDRKELLLKYKEIIIKWWRSSGDHCERHSA